MGKRSKTRRHKEKMAKRRAEKATRAVEYKRRAEEGRSKNPSKHTGVAGRAS